MKSQENPLMEKIMSLAKRRGFIFQGSEIYGGLAGTWDYGPMGALLKQNIKREWWRMFVTLREDMYGVDTAILMNEKVWAVSGHIKNFVDPMVDCKKCKMRYRADKLAGVTITPTKHQESNVNSYFIEGWENIECPNCHTKGDWTAVRPFNMMFKTHVGPVEDTSAETYLRPETAQGMFVNFKNVLDSMHPKLPFGMAQIGKAFRNEITPGNFIFRTREFEQMEIEYFIRAEEWETQFEYWQAQIKSWLAHIGIANGVHEREVPKEERAHYSQRTVDIDFDFPFGREELYGLAYRGDFDLKNHTEKSGVSLEYFDEEIKKKFIPHVIEPTFGVDRTVLALLASAFSEEEDKDGMRIVLKLSPRVAPFTAAVFPLLANKPALIDKAKDIFHNLNTHFSAAWDDIGNIGKRYRRQDEIGTPWCVTVDFQTLEDETVTVRDRDTMKQERIPLKELVQYFSEKLK
ncbi:MAG: glycine--tRNA ligase [bacterium]|nr:glycine--tRNA ligase [bacterium]